MASNSKAEQIVQSIKAALEGLPSLVFVERRLPEDEDELKQRSAKLFPFAGVVVDGLPARDSDDLSSNSLRVKMSLRVVINIYVQGQDTDATLLSIVDDVWRVLLQDRARGGVAMDTIITGGEALQLPPAFAMGALVVEAKYITDARGL